MDPAAKAAVAMASEEEEIPLAVNTSADADDQTSNLPFEDYKGYDNGLDDATIQMLLAYLNDEKESPCNGSSGGGGGDDDDDCVMLDGDPDKAVVVAVEKKLEEDGSEAELQITAEKGEVACRDFPHPRHLCARLPFGASSPADHCTMCHCYVCESLAPCPYWGNGTLRTDHCHATDKDRKWKVLRESFKHKTAYLKHVQDAISAPSSSQQQVNQLPSSVGRVHAASNGDLNLWEEFRAAKKMRSASRPKPTESFKRSAASYPTVYTSPYFYNLHRSLGNGDSVHPEAPLRPLQAAQVAPGKKNISSQAHSHQRAVDTTPLLRAMQVPPAASRLQLTPNRAAAAAASRLQLAPNRAAAAAGGGARAAHQPSSAAFHRTQFAHDTPINNHRKSWQDAIADMACDLGVNYQGVSSSHGEQSGGSTQSLHHQSQFSAQARASQGSSDSSNVPEAAPRLLSNDEIMKMLKAEEKAHARYNKFRQ